MRAWRRGNVAGFHPAVESSILSVRTNLRGYTMATRKQLIIAGTGIAVVGIVSYLGYKMVKQFSDMTLDDFMGENVDDLYNYRSQDLECQKGDGSRTKP